MQLNNKISFRYETVTIFKEQGKQTSMSYNPAQSNPSVKPIPQHGFTEQPALQQPYLASM